MTKAEMAAAATARLKTIQTVQAAVQKAHGKESMLLLGDRPVEAVPVISTRSIGIDRALGVGGFPRGRIIEIYGSESGGKTTLTLHTIAEAQQQGFICAFVDAEHALDTGYAKTLGVKIDELLVSQPDCGEQALDIVETCVRGGVDVVVVDSVAALTPKSEIEGDFGDAQMGAHARLMSQACRKLTGIISKTHSLVIMINQIRNKIGVMFGSNETVTGGNALKFYASVRLDIRRIGAIKDKDEGVVGGRTRVKVVKNKVAAPFREAEFDIRYGIGIDRVAETIELAEEGGVVEKSGSWYSFAGERIGQGRDAAIDFLRGKPDVLAAVRKRLREAPEELK